MKSKFLQTAAVATIVTGALVGTVHAAGSASLSLTPASGSYTQNTSFSVAVHENGDNVNVVTAKLTYDASKLTCSGVGAGAFSNTISATCGGGSVTISRYTDPGTTVSGDQVVGTVNFTATSTGTTTVNFAAGSQIASNGTNAWNGDTTGGTYTLTAPVVTPPSNPGQGGGTPTPSSDNTGSTGTTSGSTSNRSNGTSANNGTSAVAGDTTSQAATDSTPATTTSDNSKSSDKTAAVATAKVSHFWRNTGRTIVVLGVIALATIGLYKSTRRPAKAPVKSAAKKGPAKGAKLAKKTA